METQSLAGQPRATAHPALNLLPWAVSGLLAGIALVTLILGLRLLTGVPSLPEIVQDRLLGLVPGSIFGALIDRLQFWGKPLLLLGWAVGQAALCGCVGAVFGSAVGGEEANRSRGQMLALGGAAGLVLWTVVELGVMPLLGLGPLGLRLRSGLPSAAWSLPAFLVFGLLLVILQPAFSAPVRAAETDAGEEGQAASGRRAFLRLGLAGGMTALAGLALWRIAADIGERGSPATEAARGGGSARVAGGAEDAAGQPGEFVAPAGISTEVSPNEKFYVISKNLVDPTPSAAGWSLELTGMVGAPRRLSYGELRSLPTTELYATLECISNTVGGDLISNTRWTGVPLAQLLDTAGVKSGAGWVIFTSVDGYQEDLPLDEARQPTTLLAHSMNGAPISAKHGFPVRVLTTNRYGMKNPKWLTKIEVTSKPLSGFWEQQGWNAEQGVETMARFDTRPQRATAGSAVLLGGVAFSGARGISRVELSVDGGKTWSAGQIKAPLSSFTWSLWSYRWQPDQTGSHTLLLRAVDGSGVAQTGQRHESHPGGATGYDSIRVQVASA